MLSDTFDTLQIQVIDGVALITINNPPVNLFDLKLYPELLRVSGVLRDDDDIRAVVVNSANPEFFIAHFDVSLILHLPEGSPTPTVLNDFHVMCENFRTMPKPTIAVIEGRVGGGGNELAMSMDMRFASSNAIFNQPEVALGILPGGSGTVRLPGLVGRSRALEIVLGGHDIDAATAEQWGLVNRVLDKPLDFAMEFATRIATFPPQAVREAKAAIVRRDAHIEQDLLEEAGGFNRLLGDPRARKAMQNFLERGGQTVEGERNLGRLAGTIND